MGESKTMTLYVTGLDDLDPAAAFLAREQEQLGELEEEIGSLSGAPYIMIGVERNGKTKVLAISISF